MTTPRPARPRRARPSKNGSSPTPPSPPPVVEGLEWGCSVIVRPITHWWPGAIAPGVLSLLEGRTGTGKSTVAAAIAAAITGGPCLPDWTGPRDGRVIWISGEEQWHSDVLIRLHSAGVDLSRVSRLYLQDQYGAERRPSLPLDLNALSRAVWSGGVRLVVLDPLSSICDAALDLRVEQQARQFVEPVQAMLASRGACGIGMRHVKKGRGHDVREAGLGGVAMINTCRIALRTDERPRHAGEYTLSCIRCSSGSPATTRVYRMPPAPGGMVTTEWIGTDERTAQQIAAESGQDDSPGERADAMRLLRATIGDGQVRAKTIIEEAAAAGVSLRTLRRAKDDLDVQSHRVSRTSPGYWAWGPPPRGWPADLPLE